MAYMLILLSFYLTYYTFTFAKMIWKEKKFAGVVIGIMAVSFPPLAIFLHIYK